MRETFEEAEDDDAKAVLFTTQADPGFDRSDPIRAPTRDPQTLKADAEGPAPNGGEGFDEFLLELREQSREFRRPVVLVTGDSRSTVRASARSFDSRSRGGPRARGCGHAREVLEHNALLLADAALDLRGKVQDSHTAFGVPWRAEHAPVLAADRPGIVDD